MSLNLLESSEPIQACTGRAFLSTGLKHGPLREQHTKGGLKTLVLVWTLEAKKELGQVRVQVEVSLKNKSCELDWCSEWLPASRVLPALIGWLSLDGLSSTRLCKWSTWSSCVGGKPGYPKGGERRGWYITQVSYWAEAAGEIRVESMAVGPQHIQRSEVYCSTQAFIVHSGFHCNECQWYLSLNALSFYLSLIPSFFLFVINFCPLLCLCFLFIL